MSTAVIEREIIQSAPLARLPENPYGPVSLWDMYQLHAHILFKLFDEVRDFEIDMVRPLPQVPTPEEEAAVTKRFLNHLAAMHSCAETLQLSSSKKQIDRIGDIVWGP